MSVTGTGTEFIDPYSYDWVGTTQGADKQPAPLPKFKVGDLVVPKKEYENNCGILSAHRAYVPTGTILVLKVDRDLNLPNDFFAYDICEQQTGRRVAGCGGCFRAVQVELVNNIGKEANMTNRISPMGRASLDQDTQDLIQAGVLCDNLSVNNADFVLSFLIAENKAALAAEARKQYLTDKNEAAK